MKSLRQLTALAIAAAMMSSSVLSAQPYSGNAYPQDASFAESAGGYGYQESSRSPYIAPAVALGTIALVAIIAVAVQNSHHSHGHSHN